MVPTGRAMKAAEKVIRKTSFCEQKEAKKLHPWNRDPRLAPAQTEKVFLLLFVHKKKIFAAVSFGRRRLCRPAQAQAFKGEIDGRRGVQREQLAQQQAADDGNAEREAQF